MALFPESVRPVPVGLAAELFISWMVDEAFVVELDRVRVTVAITPFEMAVLFQPQRTQVWAPAPLLQVVDLPAAISAGLGATVADMKSTVE